MEKLKSFAKVNIGLWITGKRADGYHEIYTVFHTISLHDEITIKYSPSTRVITYPYRIKQEENIVFKTLKKFEEWTGIQPEVEVEIYKKIPLGAGLGGGSSNAATVLKYVNNIYNNPLEEKELFEIAKSLGADVPFFLKGGLAVGEGIGDKLRFLDRRFNEKIFIVYPDVQISSGEIYRKVTLEMLTKKEDIHIIDSLLDDFEKLFEKAENTLSRIVEESFPEVKEVLNTLKFFGYRPLVSGSGSSVFTVGEPAPKLRKVCDIKGWRLIETTLL